MNHGSNVIGTVQPVAEIGRVCRERGIPLILDVSQTAGMIAAGRRGDWASACSASPATSR